MRTNLFDCDLCPIRAPEHAPARIAIPGENEGTGPEPEMPDDWLAMRVVVANMVLPAEQDEVAESVHELPPEQARFVGATLRTLTRPFSTTLEICPDCREHGTLAQLDRVIGARLTAREERPVRDVLAPPGYVPRPVELVEED